MIRAKRLLALLLLLLTALSLCACGESDPNLGRYVCVERRSGRIPLGTADCSLELKSLGFGRLTLEGESGALRWDRTDETIYLRAGEELLTGTVREGIVRLEGPEELYIVFAREDLAAAYREELDARYEELGLWQTRWSGDWYGFWHVENASGRLADTWYDLCARLIPQPDGGLYLLLWDEDGSAAEPMAEALLQKDETDAAVAEAGYFWLEDLAGTGWTIRLEDGCIVGEGRHEAEGERFDYKLRLRPWGDTWQETEEKPYYYADWYLPLLEAGEEMPERMEIKN